MKASGLGLSRDKSGHKLKHLPQAVFDFKFPTLTNISLCFAFKFPTILLIYSLNKVLELYFIIIAILVLYF